MDELIGDIEAFCRTHQLKPSRFGRDAVNDTTFVPQLKTGREPRRATIARVRTFMATYQPAAAEREAA
ncbi:hypothetical protein [Sphingomonas sp. CARO-RG-8B-R24-01]|uniref:hypothetical protein n=1 Tax=Sphingomonas sp. CARO-RG-8B-R24-01 TaxID=2914831 RepID=UPI001F58B96D|nr:hypothetical protein [Sphingomonas sp. CARO-RG-8B-R24-01]